MIYIIENIIQILVLLLCMIAALVHAGKYRSRTWTLLALFCGSWVMDDLFWLLCQAFTGDGPALGAAGDLNWYAGYIFLYLMIVRISPAESSREKRVLPWIGPVFALGMAVFYISQWGNVISNLNYAGLMGLVMFSAIRRLMDRSLRKHLFFLILVMVFCFLEYGLWTASCFFFEYSLKNPYYWFDILLTLSFALFIPAVKKAVAE